jgi:large subunit ribosomal protein L1
MAEAKKTKSKAAKEAELVSEIVPVDSAPEAKIEIETKPTATAKAGKRSAKAAKEAEEKQIKEARKSDKSAEVNIKEVLAGRSVRSKTERAGKRYKEAAKLIDKSKMYSLNDAAELVIKTANTKFDASIEMHINLGVDPKQADQNVRDTVALPAGTGKEIKIAVLAEGEDVEKSKKAGADLVGVDEIFAKLDKEDIDFDVLISTPTLMAKLGKYARLLGPRGLMPNPKSGTVTPSPAEAVTEAKSGRIEYRVDQSGIVHLAIGKAGFGTSKLIQNAEAVLSSIRAAKPASIKGAYIKSIYLSSTMGPSIRVEV